MSFRVFRVLTVLMVCVFGPGVLAADHEVTVSPPEGQDGYEGVLRFPSGILNCYGQVSVSFGKQKFEPKSYRYRGKVYSPKDLGLASFPVKRPGAEISADLYRADTLQGRAVFSNVVFYSIGCFGETYPVIRMLGLKDEDFRKILSELSLRNLSAKVLLTDSKIEGKIEKLLDDSAEKEKEKLKSAGEAGGPGGGKALSAVPVAGKTPSASGAGSASPSPKVTGGESVSSSQSPGVSQNHSLERERLAQAALQDAQAKLNSDQTRVQAASGMANQIAESAIGLGAGLGLAFILPEAEQPLGLNESMTSGLIGILFGYSSRPEDQTPEVNMTSGSEYMIAFNPGTFMGTDPTVRTTPLASGTPFKQWTFMCEAKFFGNIKSWKLLQPFIGIGGATYREYNALMEYENSMSPSASIGFSAVWHNGWFRMGYNVVLNALDIGIAL